MCSKKKSNIIQRKPLHEIRGRQIRKLRKKFEISFKEISNVIIDNLILSGLAKKEICIFETNLQENLQEISIDENKNDEPLI